MNRVIVRDINLAKNLPYFNIVHFMSGIGENLAARLITEIGDIIRIENNKQFIMYAWIDRIV